MAHYFESLGNFLVNLFSRKNKDKKDLQKGEGYSYGKSSEKLKEKDPEESSLLLEENYRNKHKMRMQGYKIENDKINSSNYSSTQICSLKSIPVFYGLFGVLTVAFMLGSVFIEQKTVDGLYSQIGPMKMQFIPLFNLPKVNQFVFHILNTMTSVMGLLLIHSLLLTLRIKFSKRNSTTFDYVKLYLTIFYGVVSHLSHLFYGSIFFLKNFEILNSLMQKEVHISTYEFLFGIQIFFTVLFGICISLILFSIKSKPSYAIETEDSNSEESRREMRWLNYKLLILIYLVFFCVAYFLINLHNNNVILSSMNSILLKSNYSYLLAFLPYALYFLNLLFYVMFYDDLRNSEVAISMKECDKFSFENNNKNIL